MKKVLLLIISIPISAFGSSLILKASIGTGAWDAVSKCACSLINVKIGTFGIVTNIMLIFAQLILLKKDFRPIQFLQFGMSFILGNAVNFFYYDVFSNIVIHSYFIKIGLCLLGTIINSAAVGMIIKINIVTFPMGGFVKAVSDKVHKSYGLCRQAMDVFCILVVIFLVVVFHATMSLREGTILSMLVFGPCVDFFMKKFEPILIQEGNQI